MKTAWSAAVYWPVWLGLGIGTFLLREIWALASGRPQDTLSDWVWRQLHIAAHESIGQWNASDLLVFCAYMSVFVLWLPWHFFFRRFG
jgi:hypothetical protein